MQQSVMSKNAKFELEVVNSLKSFKVSPETALWQNRNAKLDFSICNIRLCPFFFKNSARMTYVQRLSAVT